MEQTVDNSQLTGALDALLKAANDTTLGKGEGSGIANSGSYSDGKLSGGGQGSMSDAGSIDEMTIGKMSAAGIDAGTIANFRAFMSDKKKKKDGEQASGGEQVPMPPFASKSGGSVEGESLTKGLEQDPIIQEAVDVSPFMEALVTRTVEAMGGLEKSLGGRLSKAQEIAVASARATVELGKLVKSQQAVIAELGKRLNVVERQPVAQPKGTTQQNGARALNKGGPGGEEQPLKKSEVLSTLSYMNLVKGIKQVNGQPTSQVIGMLEGGNVFDDRSLHEVRAFLSANPAEADAAKRYQ